MPVDTKPTESKQFALVRGFLRSAYFRPFWYYGSLEQLRASRQSRVPVQPADPGALVKTLQENGFTQVSPTPDGRVAVAGASVQQIGDLAAKSGIAVYGMQEETADLERLFFQLTQPQYGGYPQQQQAPPGWGPPPHQPPQPQQPQQHYPPQNWNGGR